MASRSSATWHWANLMSNLERFAKAILVFLESIADLRSEFSYQFEILARAGEDK